MKTNIAKQALLAGALALALGSGAAVAQTGGAVTGAGPVREGISEPLQPKFRAYVIERHHPSFRWTGDLGVNAVLPEAGVVYYDIPAEYKAPHYRYTIVNDRVVLVDPGTRRVMQIIN